MNKTVGIQLVIYSLLVAGLSYFTYHLAPSLARITVITGLVGGALCLASGLRAIGGSRSKALPLLTLFPMCYSLLSQTVTVWAGEPMPGRRPAAAVITLLLVLSLGMFIRIAYAGAMLDGQPAKPTMDGASDPQKNAKTVAQSKAAKRA
jgi:hypothetical protein